MTPDRQILRAARAMLPPHIACAVVPVEQGMLLPEEAAVMHRAVDARRREFAAGRTALRLAIAQTGFVLPASQPILSRADRRPDLPAGVSASLAHGGGQCIAIATRRPGISLGVDLEPVDSIRPDCLADSIAPFRAQEGAADPLIAFCAKEAVFKRQFPATGNLLDFSDIAVVIGSRRFVACVSGVGLMRGSWAEIAGFYLTVSFGVM